MQFAARVCPLELDTLNAHDLPDCRWVQDAAHIVTELGGRAAMPIAIEAIQQALQRRTEAATLDTMPALCEVGSIT